MANSIPFTFRKQPYAFTFRPGFFTLCLIFFVLFYVAGVWQLHRYDYKKMLLQTYHERLSGAPKNISAVVGPDVQFQSVMARGEYVNDLTMFVENPIRDNKKNYEVLTPFKIQDENKLVLVDRGWVASETPPTIAMVKGEQHISGYLKLANEYQFILGNNILNIKPIVMQKINLAELQKMTNQLFYPYILRLNAKQANGFERNWTIVTVEPQRHMAYAVQWFAMAAVLVIAFVGFCCERVNKFPL